MTEQITHYSRMVPRRTGIFLLITNYFPYSIVIPVVGLIMFLNMDPYLTLLLVSLGGGGIALFWYAYTLDLDLKHHPNPHWRRWNRFNEFIYPFAKIVQRLPEPVVPILAMLLASAPVVLGVISQVRGSIVGVEPRFGYDLYWLSYLPVILWISYIKRYKASDLWAPALLVAMCIYSLGYFFIPSGENFADKAVRLSVLLSWFFFLSLILHFSLRRVAQLRGHSEVAVEITEKLRSKAGYINAFDIIHISSEKDEHLNEIAGIIGKSLKYDRVFILVRYKDELIMKGMYGISDVNWPSKGWSISDSAQPSITGWVARNKMHHLCSDTRSCDLFFNPEQAFHCRSEAAVPILVDDECVGVIDIESNHKKAFHHSDVRILTQIANAIATALSHEREIITERNKAYGTLDQVTTCLVSSPNLDDALHSVLEVLRERFEADLAIIYKHAVATSVPLPDLIRSGEFKFEHLLGRPITTKSRLVELANKDEDIYIQPFAEKDDLLVGPIQTQEGPQELDTQYDFARREGVKSMIYLKLKVGDEMVGSLFLNYRHRKQFSFHEVNSLQSFAKVLALSILLKRQLERAQGPLAGAIPLAHSDTGAAFESINRNFEELKEKIYFTLRNSEEIKKPLGEFKQKLDELKLHWSTNVLTEKSSSQDAMVMDSISQLESRLRKLFPSIEFRWNLNEFLRFPSGDLGEAAYKLIAEGVSNALVHGKADYIEIRCINKMDIFEIVIRNNGELMSSDSRAEINELQLKSENMNELRKRTGIIPILLDAKRWFGASWKFNMEENRFTTLKVVFFSPEVLSYREEDEDEG